jgi:hypothetical protein
MQNLLLRAMAFIVLTSASAAVYALPYLTITSPASGDLVVTASLGE